MDDLTREFIAESQDGLERMERCLTELERRPGDRELVAEIFRVVHTIKGTTGFLGFGRMETLAHTGESLLVGLREGKLAVTSELIGGLLQLTDGLRGIVQLVAAKGSEGLRSTDDDRELIELLGELQAGKATKAGGWSAGAVAGAVAQDRTLRIEMDVLNRMMNLVRRETNLFFWRMRIIRFRCRLIW